MSHPVPTHDPGNQYPEDEPENDQGQCYPGDLMKERRIHFDFIVTESEANHIFDAMTQSILAVNELRVSAIIKEDKGQAEWLVKHTRWIRSIKKKMKNTYC